MATEAKKQEVSRLKEYFMESNCAVFCDYLGLTAEEMTALRRELRKSNARFRVVKNTLARMAVRKTPFEKAETLFSGPVSIAFSSGEDISAPARALIDFAKRNEKLEILGGVLEGEMLDPAGIKKLAGTPPKPVVQSMLLGTLQAPARNFLGALEGVARKFLYVLNAYADKKKEI